MNDKLLLALIDSIIEKKLSVIKPGLRGPMGPQGRPGAPADQESLRIEFTKLIDDKFTETKAEIDKLIEEKPDQTIEAIRGPMGPKGRDGKDFNFEDAREEIDSIILAHIKQRRDELKLKFEDLSEEEKSELKGQRGHRGQKGKAGRDGKDFSFEENEEEITSVIHSFIEENKKSFLNFSDLTEEEKESLKLKFSDLTQEDKKQLKGEQGKPGKRGQRGTRGKSSYDIWLEEGNQGSHDDFIQSLIGPKGEKGDIGLMGPMGPPGMSGPRGPQGVRGERGEDASFVTEIDVVSLANNTFRFDFYYSDGSVIETNSIKLEDAKYFISQMFSSGGGSGGLENIEVYQDGALVTTTAKLNFTGDITVTENGDTADIDLTIPPTPTPEIEVEADGVVVDSAPTLNFIGFESVTYDPVEDRIDIDPGSAFGKCVQVLDEGVEVTSCAVSLDFVGNGVEVIPKSVMADWPSLDVIDPISYYDFGQDEVEVLIPGDTPWTPIPRQTIPAGQSKVIDAILLSKYICSEYKVCMRSIDQSQVMWLNYFAFKDDTGLGDQISGKNGSVMDITFASQQTGTFYQFVITNNELFDVELTATRLLS